MGNEGHHRKDDEGGVESELHLGNSENGFVSFELWGTDCFWIDFVSSWNHRRIPLARDVVCQRRMISATPPSSRFSLTTTEHSGLAGTRGDVGRHSVFGAKLPSGRDCREGIVGVPLFWRDRLLP